MPSSVQSKMVLILAAMTLMLCTITIVVLCLNHHRLDLLVALMVFYLAATGFAAWRLFAAVFRNASAAFFTLASISTASSTVMMRR